ncbi:MAG: hypothetical protein AAF289_09505 [Cyanobacteria bacterium P01_A01_bin.135]
MTYDRINRSNLPAPCIVDVGTIVNKRDMRRILSNVGAVHYRYLEGETCLAEGEGYVVEVFSDPNQATLVANQTLYLNVSSFDGIELRRSKDEAQFDLLQDNRRLQLIPLSSPLHEQAEHAIELATLEAMVSDVFPSDMDVRDADLS